VVAVTVAAPDGVTADALSTTLFVLGPERGRDFLRRHAPTVTALWVRDGGGAEPTASDVVLAEGGAGTVRITLPPPGAVGR
jgi:thiamine biosynthesis lipoprotein ApbE